MLLAIGTGALLVTLSPLTDASGAEEARAVLAGFWLSDDFCAHHADEAIVKGLYSLVFLELRVNSFRNFHWQVSWF